MKKLFILTSILVCVLAGWFLFINIFIESETAREAAPAETKFISIPDDDVIAYQEIDNGAPTTALFVGGLSGWSGT